MGISYSKGHIDDAKYQHIFHQSWVPQGDIKAVILLVHGMSEHSSRYSALVNHLTSHHYAVHSWDHPGHGRSGGDRKYIERFSDFGDVMEQRVEYVKRQHVDLPIYVIAHSMGGLISVNYLLDHQADFAGVILSAPAIRPVGGFKPWIMAVGNFLSMMLPKVELKSTNARSVCRDPEIAEQFKKDPLSTSGRTSIRLLAEIVSGMKRVQREASILTLPILILQGTDDRIVDPAGANNLKALVSSNDKTVTLYQDFYHELFNDLEKARVFEDVINWLEARVE